MPTITKQERIETNGEQITDAVSKLPEIEQGLLTMNQSIADVSEALLKEWLGTAKETYITAVEYVTQHNNKMEQDVIKTHGLTLTTCKNREILDGIVADAANRPR